MAILKRQEGSCRTMSDVTFNKNVVLVKDDFFNDIVNGLSDENDELQDKKNANQSGNELKGKQLNRFKRVITIVASNIETTSLVSDYVSISKEAYEKLKIEEMQQAFQLYDQHIKELNDDIKYQEEEEDEDEDDKRFIDFIKKCYNWYSVVTFGIRFYKIYKSLKNTFDESKLKSYYKKYDFDLSNYKKGKILDFEQFNRDFTLVINNNWVTMIMDTMKPLLYNITKVIIAATDTAFHYINRGIYKWIFKQISLFLIEVGILTFLTFVTGGLGAVALGVRAAAWVKKIRDGYKIFKRSEKLAKVLKTARKTKIVTKKFARNAKNYIKSIDVAQRKKIVHKTVGVTSKVAFFSDDAITTFKTIRDATKGVFNIVSVDKDELLEHEKKIKTFSQQFGNDIINSLDKGKKIVDDEFDTMYDNMIKSCKQYFESIYKKLLRNFSKKYGGNVKVKGQLLDFTQMEKLINFFEIDYELKNDDYLIFDDNGNYKINNYTIDKTFKKIQVDEKNLIDLDKDFRTIRVKDENDKDIELDFSNNKGIGKKAFFNQGFKNKGKELLYDKLGRMSGVRLGFNLEEDGQTTHSINYITQDGKVSQRNKKLNVYFHSKDNEFLLGVERVWSDKGFQTKTRLEGGKIESLVIKDLSEIITPRQKWLDEEKTFNKNVSFLSDKLSKIVGV